MKTLLIGLLMLTSFLAVAEGPYGDGDVYHCQAYRIKKNMWGREIGATFFPKNMEVKNGSEGVFSRSFGDNKFYAYLDCRMPRNCIASLQLERWKDTENGPVLQATYKAKIYDFGYASLPIDEMNRIEVHCRPWN